MFGLRCTAGAAQALPPSYTSLVASFNSFHGFVVGRGWCGEKYSFCIIFFYLFFLNFFFSFFKAKKKRTL